LETTTRIEVRSAHCPACKAQLQLGGRQMIGEVYGCGQCGAQLEVASTEPLLLEPLARIDEQE